MFVSLTFRIPAGFCFGEPGAEACSRTVDCYDKLSEAIESCRVNLDETQKIR